MSLWYTGLYDASVFRFGVFGMVRMDNLSHHITIEGVQQDVF